MGRVTAESLWGQFSGVDRLESTIGWLACEWFGPIDLGVMSVAGASRGTVGVNRKGGREWRREGGG